MTKNTSKESVIKTLEKNAKKDVFDSIYQLYEYYLNGTYVDQDPIKAEGYLLDANKIFATQKLEVTSLKLQNFRAFKDVDIKIPDKKLTVIIGNNGGGKSTILDAIYHNISWLHNRITKKGGGGEPISDLDLTLGSKAGFSSIITKFKLNKSINIDMELVNIRDGFETSKKSHIKDITKIGSMYKKAKLFNDKVNLPILAYYTVNRALDVNSKDMASFDETSSIKEVDQFEGYIDSLNGKADFKYFFRWFKRLDDIEKHQKVKNEASFLNELNEIEQLDISAEEILKLIKDKRSEFKASKSISDAQKLKNYLNDVIDLFMPGYGNLEIQMEPYLSLTLEKNKQKLNVLQLSQGEKTLLALVLDISRRLITLNPSLPNPLDGNGIILIDEFDLHLHPEWQRNVVRGLSKAFKNCQFIVTTHSPQIIGEVKHNQLIIMKRDDNNEINYYQPSQSYGLTSNDILDEIMNESDNGEQLIRNNDVEKELKKIHKLIADCSYDKALIKISQLEKLVNGEIPELLSAKMDIELANWED
jgi:predicted ATP-binding protein involved in virulence